MRKCVALIVAAGKGKRFGDNTPKQYHDLCGEMLLRRTIKAFLSCSAVTDIKVVIHRDNVDFYQKASAGLPILPPCFGGDERQDSVRLGLESLSAINPDVVLIHDAARPFVNNEIILSVIDAIHQGQGAISAVPVTDTIKKVGDNGEILSTVDRSHLWKAATPQGFVYQEILSAHLAAKGLLFTDDAAVAENQGLKTIIVKGSERNIKITTMEDLRMAEKLLSAETQKEIQPRIKTGFGFDVHAFTTEKNYCTICGVKIPFDKGLKGHSDADVGLHALTDAILGAIGLGDIGTHFSDKNERWKDADSRQFVDYAVNSVFEKGGKIENVDLTVICEAPRIGTYRTAMTEVLSSLLHIPPEDVNIKGTTTEHLGFTGRKEGIAACAVVTISI